MNFVHSEGAEWLDVASEGGRSISVDSLAPRLVVGRDVWIVQTFQMLRQRGYPVRLSGKLAQDAINVIHYDDIKLSHDLWRFFLVSVRADRDPSFVSQVEVVQNRSCVWAETDVYMPHWPQPGLVPRNPARGSRIETVAYMGREEHLAPEFRSDDFRQSLAEIGMCLRVSPERWWDYGDADVTLAVRDGDPLFLAGKPSSKLVNSWLAGCPAILSDECGYLELRESPLDYFRARNAAEALEILRRLREHPDLYVAMASSGLRRAQPYTATSVASTWEEALNGPIASLYQRWRAHRGATWRGRFRYWFARGRRRIWGTQVVAHPRGGWRKLVRPIRCTLALPGHRRAWDVRRDF